MTRRYRVTVLTVCNAGECCGIFDPTLPKLCETQSLILPNL